jgi:hypothetical protein
MYVILGASGHTGGACLVTMFAYCNGATLHE